MSNRPFQDRFARLWPVLLVFVLVVWHGVHNWIWLRQNVVLSGWDKARHLAQSLAYNNMLPTITLHTLFNAIVADQVRTPLAPMIAIIPYRLFGVSGDVGTMVNVLYLTITLVATWRIGVLLQGRRLAALSVVLLALFPMFYAMSRYFYIEYPLMAMVALTVYLLLASEGFEKRRTTLVFGVCLGLGLLTKRTFVVFALAPVTLVVLRSAVLPSVWRRLKGGVHVAWKDAALAVLGGLVLAGVWALPNWEQVQSLALRGWLYPLWAGMVAVTIYLMRRRPGPDTNLLSALALGVTLGSLWYLANISFVQRALLFGYGVDDPRGRTIDLLNLSTYTDYLAVLVTGHLSLLFSLLFASAALVLGIMLLKKGRLWPSLRKIGIDWWAVILWAVGPYLILTLSIYHETRAITPILPALALLGGELLSTLPYGSKTAGTRVSLSLKAIASWAFLALLFIGGLVQFYAVSFEPLHGLVQATSLRLPALGETSLFAQGGYLQRPASGVNAPGYWIEPDVLQRLERQRIAQNWETASLGLLVNDRQINFEHFAFLGLAGGYFPQIGVERLARAKGEEPLYPRLFRQDYLLVKRENAAVDADSKVMIERILDDPPPLFQMAFELEHIYSVPDGDSVYLFRRRERPPEGAAADFIPELAKSLESMIGAGDAVVVMPPNLVPLLGQHLNQLDIDVRALPAEQPAEETLAEIAAGHSRIWVVFGELEGNDLDNAGRRWLNENTYRAWDAWFGPTQLAVYGLASPAQEPQVQPVGFELGGAASLQGYALDKRSLTENGTLLLTLLWQAREAMNHDYKVFVHLVDGTGQLVAQRDTIPVAGLRPTATWAAGEPILDRIGLVLRADVEPGTYHVLVGMYDPETMERLPVLDTEGRPIGDTIPLTTVEISGSSP